MTLQWLAEGIYEPSATLCEAPPAVFKSVCGFGNHAGPDVHGNAFRRTSIPAVRLMLRVAPWISMPVFGYCDAGSTKF